LTSRSTLKWTKYRNLPCEDGTATSTCGGQLCSTRPVWLMSKAHASTGLAEAPHVSHARPSPSPSQSKPETLLPTRVIGPRIMAGTFPLPPATSKLDLEVVESGPSNACRHVDHLPTCRADVVGSTITTPPALYADDWTDPFRLRRIFAANISLRQLEELYAK
jgi:hypothetical protein